MGFLSSLGNLIDTVVEAAEDVGVYSSDAGLIATAYSKIGEGSYSKDDINNMIDGRGRIAFTIKPDIREDDIDMRSMLMEERQMVMAILENVERIDGKYVTPGFSIDEWVAKSKKCGNYETLTRDDIIRMSKKW